MALQALLIDDSEDFRLLVSQYLALEWGDAEIIEWDPVTQ